MISCCLVWKLPKNGWKQFQKYQSTFGFSQNFRPETHPPIDIRVRTKSTSPPPLGCHWYVQICSDMFRYVKTKGIIIVPEAGQRHQVQTSSCPNAFTSSVTNWKINNELSKKYQFYPKYGSPKGYSTFIPIGWNEFNWCIHLNSFTLMFDGLTTSRIANLKSLSKSLGFVHPCSRCRCNPRE